MRRPALAHITRRHLLRRPLPFWALTFLLALATALSVVSTTRRAEATLAGFGETRPVAVALETLQPGDVVGGGAVTLRDLPAAVVPDSALGEIPEGDVVTAMVLAGEPLVAERLAPGGLGETAALLPPETRGVAVAHDSGLALAPGDHVDVLVTLASGSAEVSDPTFPVAEAALVLATNDSAVTLAVDEGDVAMVTQAQAIGTVTLVLTVPGR